MLLQLHGDIKLPVYLEDLGKWRWISYYNVAEP